MGGESGFLDRESEGEFVGVFEQVSWTPIWRPWYDWGGSVVVLGLRRTTSDMIVTLRFRESLSL